MDIIINDRHYEHLTTELERIGTIYYSDNSGVTLANTLTLDPTATRLTYKLTIDSALKDQTALQNLWNDLIVPRREGVKITMPYNQSTISFRAKVEEISQPYLGTINGEQVWDKMSVTLEAITPLLEV